MTTRTPAAGPPGAPTSDRPALRPAAPADLAAIERLLAASGLPLDGVRDALAEFVVAEHATAIVGVAGLELCGDAALLRSVAIDPAWRSRGVGRALVDHVIAGSERRGVVALYLLTTTAARYFARLGFIEIARADVPADVAQTVEFRTACPASATAMRRTAAERRDGA